VIKRENQMAEETKEQIRVETPKEENKDIPKTK